MLRARFVYDKETRHFLECIVAASKPRTFHMPKGAPLWRAQLREPNLKAWDVEDPFPAERMKPLLNCREGRLNPKNIPCLYLATDEHTAMSEVRPWVGVMGTLAEFLTTRELSLVNCTERHASGIRIGWLAGGEPTPEEKDRHVWGELNNSFSEPTSSTETTAHYAPTQVLGETFKGAGFDGVMYNSSVADGVNVALFDLASADVVGCHLFQTARLNYKFDVSKR
jgi:RES domain